MFFSKLSTHLLLFQKNRNVYNFARIHKQIQIKKDLISNLAVKKLELHNEAEKQPTPKIKQNVINSQEQSQNENSTQERLSKYLSRTGICSRRQAEKMIASGLVLVDKKKVLSNVPIDPSRNEVKIFTKQGERIPMSQKTSIWLLNKPVGMICSHSDPAGRPSVYDYVRKQLKTNQHIISVGRLDFNSEGVILLTNDGALARTLELPASNIEREYRVRVYGQFNEEKLLRIRAGMTISGIKYGPFWCQVDKRQSRNTWLLIRLTTGKNREIRKVMQKLSLRVNRLIRTRYGPYNLGRLQPGEIIEVEIDNMIKRKVYLSMRKNLEQIQDQNNEEKQLKKISFDNNLNQEQLFQGNSLSSIEKYKRKQ